MSWNQISDNRLGVQPITVSNAANPATFQVGQSPFFGAEHALGTIIRAVDTTFGEGEFIYLLGVVNTVAGLMVTYDASTFQTTIVPSGANAVGPFAVAMSANVAGQFGWYQISGLTTILKTAVTVNPQVALYVSTTAGRVRVIASAGRQLLGARSANLTTVTSTTSTVLVMMDRPGLQGQIT